MCRSFDNSMTIVHGLYCYPLFKNSALIDHRNDVKMFKTFLVPGASLIFRTVNAFRVTWCKRRSKAVSRAFSSDTSPKCIDREGLGNSRTGIRQVCNHELQASGFTANFEHFGVISILSIRLYTTDHVYHFFFHNNIDTFHWGPFPLKFFEKKRAREEEKINCAIISSFPSLLHLSITALNQSAREKR